MLQRQSNWADILCGCTHATSITRIANSIPISHQASWVIVCDDEIAMSNLRLNFIDGVIIIVC